MMELLGMMTSQKIGLTSSASVIAGSAVAFMSDQLNRMASIAQAPPVPVPVPGQGVTETALGFAGFGLITAIGSIVVPVLMEFIKTWGNTRVVNLEAKVESLLKDSLRLKEAEKAAYEAKLEAGIYKQRLEDLEGRTAAVEDRANINTKVIRGLKETATHSGMSPVAAIITNAYGTVLSATGQTEFIVHWNPQELVDTNIRAIIPKPLHPDPVHHTDRSFNPDIDFKDRAFRGIKAITKDGAEVLIDVMLYRWFVEGGGRTVDSVRFGKIIRKHVPDDNTEPFPEAEAVLPGFVRNELVKSTVTLKDELAKNTETLKEVSSSISKASEAFSNSVPTPPINATRSGTFIYKADGTGNAHS